MLHALSVLGELIRLWLASVSWLIDANLPVIDEGGRMGDNEIGEREQCHYGGA
jgi:hypothetical protein